MKNIGKVVLLIIMLSVNNNVFAQNNFELVHFNTEDEAKIEAAYFDAGKSKIVIFAHGAIFNKESWYFLAEEFQRKGISVLSIDFRGYGKSITGSTNKKLYDILGAIAYAKEQGFKDISIVGASMGGAAILSALSYKQVSISKVVLLAPAGGPKIVSDKLDKLFVISKEERLHNRVKQIYGESAEPKRIKEYEGNAHAQHMFKSNNAEDLKILIIDFIFN
jgi:uncharacterized protein